MVTKKGLFFYIRFRPFDRASIDIKTYARSKTEAKQIECDLLTACRSRDYSFLNPVSREVCARMFNNRGWEIPSDLIVNPEVTSELTLFRACELFFKDAEINSSPSRWRYEYSGLHLLEELGQGKALKSIWVPELKRYQAIRKNQGAAPDTVNRELSTLSKIFQVMIELRLIKDNPVRLLKRLSTKSGERQVYLSFQDVQRIMDKCPAWFRPIVLTGYYTGMRRGEILNLTRKQVNLSKRIIILSPEDTKEAHWKRVPIHKDLIPILEECLKVTSLETHKVFLLHDKQGGRPIELETFKNPWPRACEALEKAELLKKPFPRFHDLRHTWRTNARRSEIDSQIAESILGHWFKGKSVSDRYGRISDQELIQAIDKLTFDHGETEILVASSGGRGVV
jgi:integrase